MAEGIWKQYSQVIDDERLYIAGRQLDTSQPLHGGSIEYSGGYTLNREAVEATCKQLNG